MRFGLPFMYTYLGCQCANYVVHIAIKVPYRRLNSWEDIKKNTVHEIICNELDASVAGNTL